MKKSFIVYYVFSCTLYKREISFIFCDSESSSVEFLYYQDGFLVAHYWLSSPSSRGLRDVTLTAADIDPPTPLPPSPFPLPPPPSHHTPYTGTQVDGIRIKRFVFDTSRHEYYIIYKIKLYWGWLDFTGIIIFFEVEQK